MPDNLLGLQVKTFKKCLHTKRWFINCSAKLMTFWCSVEGERERRFGQKRKDGRLAVGTSGWWTLHQEPSPPPLPHPVSRNNCCEQLSCGHWWMGWAFCTQSLWLPVPQLERLSWHLVYVYLITGWGCTRTAWPQRQTPWKELQLNVSASHETYSESLQYHKQS